MSTKLPKVQWAQRNDIIYMSVDIQDSKNVKLEVEGTKFKFSCEDSKGEKYAFEFELSHEVIKEESKWTSSGRTVEIILPKKETEKFWEKLYSGKKLHYVGIDWNKWVEEGEEEALDDNSAFNMDSWQQQQGGMMNMQQFGDRQDDEDEMPSLGDMDEMPPLDQVD
jgi:cytosolic prostaglandin-E synthase